MKSALRNEMVIYYGSIFILLLCIVISNYDSLLSLMEVLAPCKMKNGILVTQKSVI